MIGTLNHVMYVSETVYNGESVFCLQVYYPYNYGFPRKGRVQNHMFGTYEQLAAFNNYIMFNDFPRHSLIEAWDDWAYIVE